MKETEIFRRVDDLGRVVIPKDIRRQLKIEEGDALEILMNEDSVTFKRAENQGKTQVDGWQIIVHFRDEKRNI